MTFQHCCFFLFLFLSLSSFVLSTSTPDPPGVQETRSNSQQQRYPNIILIIADDLGWNDVSFHGSPQISTPNLDALAFSGIILNNYYVSPICTPSRSALFTGKHPIHTGMQHDVIYGTTPYGLSLEEKLLPEYLKDLNYKTHLVGKWHLGHFRNCYTPLCRGFDSHFGPWTGHKDYYDNTAEESNPQAWGYDTRRGFDVSYDHWSEYTTDVYTEEAISVISNHKNESQDQGLFLTMSHTAVHSANPYKLLQAPQSAIDKFPHIKDKSRRTFAAMVSKMDDSVGQVVKALAENEMLDNSIIIFTTDNGGPAAGFNGNAASNWPLRGVKNTLWEGGVRGAGFIWSPKFQSMPRVSDAMMHITDWLPTILGGLGVNPDQNKNLDGLNLWEVLNNASVPSPRTEFLHNIDDIYGNSGVRQGDYKLLHGTTYGGSWDGWYGPSGFDPENAKNIVNESEITSGDAGVGILSLRNGMLENKDLIDKLKNEARVICPEPKKKVKCDLKSGQYCLYNVRTDPCEYVNLAKEMPDKVKELQDLLKQFRKSAVPLRNIPKDPRGQPKFWQYTWTNFMDFVEPVDQQMEKNTTRNHEHLNALCQC